eukprot:6204743-Pleurochrysis_carterae.AAC.1
MMKRYPIASLARARSRGCQRCCRRRCHHRCCHRRLRTSPQPCRACAGRGGARCGSVAAARTLFRASVRQPPFVTDAASAHGVRRRVMRRRAALKLTRECRN